MEIYLGYETALACLRSLDKIDRRLLVPNRAVAKWSFDENEALQLAPEEAADHGCLHLMVPDARMRRSGDSLRFHVWNPKTHQPCFFRYRNGVFVSTPEALFVQLSHIGNEINLMKLAFELCGNYCLDKTTESGFRSRPPLTSSEKLLDFAHSIGLGNKARAIKALKFVKDNSASPMETRLALALGLPATKGGYGLGMPEMNAEVKASQNSDGLVSYGLYHCDLFWPDESVALEYNSTLYHSTREALASDSKRMNDLKAIGIRAFTATSKQVATPRDMDRLAKVLARAMGKRIRARCQDAELKKLELRRRLFSEEQWDKR